MNPILIPQITNCRSHNHSPVRLFAVAAALLLLAGALTSCSTTRGFGRDVEKTGDAIQDAATQ